MNEGSSRHPTYVGRRIPNGTVGSPTASTVVRWAVPALFALFAIALWHLVVTRFHVPTYLVPSPVLIFADIRDNFRTMATHIGWTALEAALGLIAAIIVGGTLGTLFAVFRRLEQAILPWAVASQAVPIIAIAPLLVLWFGNGLTSKVIMAALGSLFPMLVNTTRGLGSADPLLLELARVYSARGWTIFRKLRLPSALPYITAGMRVAAAFAMIGAIVAELAGSDKGIGYVIMQATYRFDAVRLFSAILLSGVCGLSFFGLVVLLERIALRRHTQWTRN